MARVGDAKAPQMRGGCKAHGPVPRDHSFPMNKKTVILGLKTILSARLAEGGVTVLDKFPPVEKTKEMRQYFPKDERILFVHDDSATEANLNSLNHIKNVDTITPDALNVKHMVKNSKVYFTVDALQYLQDSITDKEKKLYRNRKTNRRIKEDEVEPATVVRSKPLKDIIEKYELDIPTDDPIIK